MTEVLIAARRSGLAHTILAGLLAFCCAAFGTQAAAQFLPSASSSSPAEGAVLPDPLTPEAVDKLFSRLSDAEVRGLLLDQLHLIANEVDASETLDVSDIVSGIADIITGSVQTALGQLPGAGDQFAELWRKFYGPREALGLLELAGWLAIVILGGLAFEVAARWIAARARMKNTQPPDGGFRGAVVVLVRRMALESAGLVAFYFGCKVAIAVAVPGDDLHRFVPNINTKFIEFLVFNVVIYTRIAAMLARFALSPHDKEQRLVLMDCDDAKFLYRNIVIIGALWGMMGFFIPFFPTHGVPASDFRIQFWLQLLLFGWMFVTVWRSRHALTRMLTGHADGAASRAEGFVARAYPVFALVLIAANLLLVEFFYAQEWRWLLDGRQNTTLLILIFAPALDGAVRGLVGYFARPIQGEGVIAEAAYRATLRSYIRIGRVILFGLALVVVARIWGVEWSMLGSAGFGGRMVVGLISSLAAAMIGYIIWEITTLTLNRKLAAEQTAAGIDLNDDEPGGGEGGGTGGSRLSTVLPLVRIVAQSAIVTITALIILGDLGVDITPLLAGAGIIGLAVGFGAQTLVADIVGGVFFLLDDAFRNGEYVSVEGTVGTVEKISIRSMQLRHHKGPVHTIPYSQIPKITNFSRDWVIMKLKFTVPFETDPNKVKKIFKTIGKEMQEVPEFAADLLQPFKSQGVFDFDDVGMIIRGKFMAKPGKQFTLRKEIYNRVKAAFAEHGIEFARREVRVALPNHDKDDPMTKPENSAVLAAAAQTIEEKAPR